jgi:hypothetical protein
MDRPEFHRLAEYELNEAAQYYDLDDPGLGAAFLDEVDRCLQSIQAAPKRERYPLERFGAGFSADFHTRSCTRSRRVASGCSP